MGPPIWPATGARPIATFHRWRLLRLADDEHYYGLGQNQEGFLDHRGHPVRCWNDYNSPAAPTTCVPFLVTNKGYGMLWDNPSKTTFVGGFNEQTRWSSEVGDRVSFFVIAAIPSTKSMPGTSASPGQRTCCPRRPMATSNASSAIRARRNFCPLRRLSRPPSSR